jgi:hypothetical protein
LSVPAVAVCSTTLLAGNDTSKVKADRSTVPGFETVSVYVTLSPTVAADLSTEPVTSMSGGALQGSIAWAV